MLSPTEKAERKKAVIYKEEFLPVDGSTWPVGERQLVSFINLFNADDLFPPTPHLGIIGAISMSPAPRRPPPRSVITQPTGTGRSPW